MTGSHSIRGVIQPECDGQKQTTTPLFVKTSHKSPEQLAMKFLAAREKEPVTLLKCGERMLFKSVDIVSNFAQHFSCIPSPTPTSSANTLAPAQTSFKFQRISEETVMKKLLTLDERNATGPDKISAKLLKLVAPSVASSLASLFNYSILSGQFPSEWKEAKLK